MWILNWHQSRHLFEHHLILPRRYNQTCPFSFITGSISQKTTKQIEKYVNEYEVTAYIDRTNVRRTLV